MGRQDLADAFGVKVPSLPTGNSARNIALSMIYGIGLLPHEHA